uniref:Uncharacterized protein n=1 Tax=Peronospora matthiolae TaxID=2874970 RepID=A0AAV1VF44_9STRA
MVNKSMSCAVKAAGNADARLRSASAEEAEDFYAAGYNPTASSSSRPAAGTAVGSRCRAPRDLEKYELEHIYSGESDEDAD